MPRKSSGRRGGSNNSDAQRGLAIFILTVLVTVFIYWQHNAIGTWLSGIAGAIWGWSGWGLIFIDLAIGVLVWLAFKQCLDSLFFRWNRWLGITAFTIAAWGILGFLHQGGSFGRTIIGDPGSSFAGIAFGILRLLLLLLIGVILVAPGAFYRSLVHFFSWLFHRPHLRRDLIPVTANQPALPIPTDDTPSTDGTLKPAEGLYKAPPKRKPLFPFLQGKPGRVTESQSPIPNPQHPVSAPDARQVARDVWRRFGEADSLTVVDGWKLPPLDILEKTQEVQFTEADNQKRAKLIEDALASYGVNAKVVEINAGPTVTQFGIEPGWDRKFKETKEKDKDGNIKVHVEEASKTRVKVDRITSLANDLALALAAPSLRIEAPVPGKAVIGIEVPNTVSSAVSLRGVIETNNFQKMEAKSKMTLALGKGAGGETVAADLTKMPHLLIAGSTGSGKTVCLNAIISCLLMYNTPNDVRFIMVDPKRVELTSYNSIPHLAAPVIVEADKALEALRWLSMEMDKRYQKMATFSARNIETYNKGRTGTDKMSYLVLVIDELADLMMAGGDEVERIICRLAQLARAVGIHLVVATQRPSVDVITGLIKANFPTRISFAVVSQVDSRTILDSVGAEKLLGRGDMLYMPTEADKPKRLQGCFLSDAEIERLVYFWGNQKKDDIPSLKLDELHLIPAMGKRSTVAEDPLLVEARKLSQEHKQLSASFLQRHLRIGYPRAARIMEQLQEEGVEATAERDEKAG
ncbi:MAG: DNA translocase FtsK [Dehalococcoidales bacterium]|nr:DNA translocase FtsK [Dehalococcoidales bacterium]